MTGEVDLRLIEGRDVIKSKRGKAAGWDDMGMHESLAAARLSMKNERECERER